MRIQFLSFFFFSSRRRHTRSLRDWSSDVCSSDLLAMIQDMARLDTSHDDIAIVINMDGQGAPRTKLATWQAVVGNAPKAVYFGWKDFYTKDTPMLGPVRTIRHHPE